MRRRQAILSICAIALLLVACGTSDPRARMLEQRARWNVAVLSLAQDDAGTINLSVRISGPPNSSLEQLTVRIHLSGADGQEVGRVWHTFDLSDIERGGPADRFVRIPEYGHVVDGAGIDMVLAPTAEEQAEIRELQGLS